MCFVICQGLKLHGVHEIMQHWPAEGTGILCIGDEDDLETVKAFCQYGLTPKEEDNSTRETEETIIYNFHRFLKQISR